MPIWLRAAVFIVAVPGTVAGWLPWDIAGRPRISLGDGSPLRWLGALLALLGWGLLLWCARDFALRGRGTPAPYDAPRSLVTSGLYQFVRNPMYVSVLTAIFGQAIWYRSINVAVYGAIVALFFHTFVRLYEEPKLRALFGAAYTEYCQRVPRWFPRYPRR